MNSLLHFPPDINAIPRHHLYRQITDAERQANHDQEREIYEQSCAAMAEGKEDGK
jgi:hypothetical protein